MRQFPEYGVNAPPVSYMHKGKQYITVAAPEAIPCSATRTWKDGDEILTFSLE